MKYYILPLVLNEQFTGIFQVCSWLFIDEYHFMNLASYINHFYKTVNYVLKTRNHGNF